MKLEDIKKLFTKEGFLQWVRELNGQQRYIACFLIAVLFLGLVRWIFDPGHPKYETVQDESSSLVTQASPETEGNELTEAEPGSEEGAVAEDEKANTNRQGNRTWPYFVNQPIRSYVHDKEFGDGNDIQLTAARKNGISVDIPTREDAQKLVDKGQLVWVGASPLFYLDDLHHSMPYLVPKAYRLLNRIGINFIDSLQSKGVPPHKIVVTSVLRSEEDVTRLKRQNGNAVSESAHAYATTFDISYTKYDEMADDPMKIHDGKREILMKRALGEVLRDLRYEGRCYVKYEVKQGCFHITVR